MGSQSKMISNLEVVPALGMGFPMGPIHTSHTSTQIQWHLVSIERLCSVRRNGFERLRRIIRLRLRMALRPSKAERERLRVLWEIKEYRAIAYRRVACLEQSMIDGRLLMVHQAMLRALYFLDGCSPHYARDDMEKAVKRWGECGMPVYTDEV